MLTADAIRQAHRTQVALHGDEVEYQRDSQRWYVPAVMGGVPMRTTDEEGLPVLIWGQVDFLVEADVLPVEPQYRDRIIADGRVYEVAAPDGEPVWRWSGPAGSVRRIHTQQIA